MSFEGKTCRKLTNGQDIDYSGGGGEMAPGLHLSLDLDYFLLKHVYWYIQQISGEPLQDHWSSGFLFLVQNIDCGYSLEPPL